MPTLLRAWTHPVVSEPASDDGGANVFVDISAVQQSGLPELREGQTVEFQIEPGKGGKTAAANLKLR